MKRLLALILAALMWPVLALAQPATVAGTFTSSTTAGTASAPFSCYGRPTCPFNVAVWASSSTAPGTSLTATVYLVQSTDGGTTYLPMTAAGTQLYSWTANASEMAIAPQAGALYELVCSTQPTATINYRITQGPQ